MPQSAQYILWGVWDFLCPTKGSERRQSAHRPSEPFASPFSASGVWVEFDHHNMLELLLFYAIPRRDTNKLVHRLIRHYGSISGVFDADADELLYGAGLAKKHAARAFYRRGRIWTRCFSYLARY